MKKKKYISPETEVVKLRLDTKLLVNSSLDDTEEIDDPVSSYSVNNYGAASMCVKVYRHFSFLRGAGCL